MLYLNGSTSNLPKATSYIKLKGIFVINILPNTNPVNFLS